MGKMRLVILASWGGLVRIQLVHLSTLNVAFQQQVQCEYYFVPLSILLITENPYSTTIYLGHTECLGLRLGTFEIIFFKF